MNKDTFSPIIPFGQAVSCFDEKGIPNFNEPKTFGFVTVLVNSDKPQLLCFDQKEYKFLANGVLAFMQHEELEEITTNGGGVVEMSVDGSEFTSFFQDMSPSFGWPFPYEVCRIMNFYQYHFSILNTTFGQSLNKSPIQVSGKKFTLAEVQNLMMNKV